MSWKGGQRGLRDLAEGLVKAGALQFGTFSLPGGKESSYYVNLRALPSYPGAYRLVVDAVAGLVSKKTPKADALFGIPLTGLTIASPVALALKKPLIYARTQKDSEGRVMEGEVRPGWNIAVVDDITDTGRSALASVKALEQEGGEVTHAFVLIDRLEGAAGRLKGAGVALNAVTDVLELAETLHSMELITNEHLDAVTRSVKSR